MNEKNQSDIIRSVLERTRLFADSDPDALDSLCEVGALQYFSDGEIVAACRDETPKATGLWVVASGCLETSRIWASGKRVVFGYQMSGQLVGIVPTLDGLPLSLDVMARGDTVAVFLPRNEFLAAIRLHPSLSLGMLALMARRARLDYERIEMLSLNSMRAIIAKMLLFLSREALSIQDGEVAVPFKISQEDIAGLLGVTRQNVNKEISWFIREGILARRYRGVSVVDPDRLIDVAGGEEPLSEAAQATLFAPPPKAFRTSD
ncbi:MAG: Crp/Fnr family transcriptional regulator [Parvibaculum sp.]|nr:Crp/Fnr family transcriptional regulator [Parvibaculum sp.]